MATGEWLRRAWSGTKRCVEALGRAADYDPVEEQRRWIASVEERIARIEARPPSASATLPQRPTQT